jgi:hypothetical protein
MNNGSQCDDNGVRATCRKRSQKTAAHLETDLNADFSYWTVRFPCRKNVIYTRSEDLSAVKLSRLIFRVITPKMKAVCSSRALVSICEFGLRYNQKINTELFTVYLTTSLKIIQRREKSTMLTYFFK